MASLQGLPPLPKSLSALLNFSSAQWKEMERLHAMRTMIQQDLNREQQQQQQLIARGRVGVSSSSSSGGGTADSTGGRKKQKISLDAQLALLRKEMVGLRQLDMSLLCQLWSLNESIQEYKHLVQEDQMSQSLSPSAWDNGLDHSSCDESESPGHYNRVILNRAGRDLNAVPETLSLTSSSSSITTSSQSSLEFGDI